MNYLNTTFFIIIGAILGSFYAVIGTRLPKNESIISPRSHCEYCGHILSWYELIPILSFFFQKGKCRNCHHHLSSMYPLTELATGLLFGISYYYFGISEKFFHLLLLSSLVIIIFVSDMKYMIILDSPLVISGIGIFLLNISFHGIEKALLSLGAGFLSFLTLFFIGKLGNILFQKEAMGGGDIKLSFIMGMSLGYKMYLIAFILATFLALPYAPFLVSSLWIVFFFYEKFHYIITFLLNL